MTHDAPADSRPTASRPRATRAMVLALALVASACGYTFAGGAPPQLVAISVAANETMRQRLELPLTRALQEALVVYSSMRPSDRGRADAVLEVALTDAKNRVLVSGRPQPLSEGSLALAVDVRLVDARSGETLRRFALADRAEFRVAVGEDEAAAAREAAIDLARKIVLGLEADF
ncbi:MAG: LPS assembly lipoprotein LptE [Planctomycetota bacterium]